MSDFKSVGLAPATLKMAQVWRAPVRRGSLSAEQEIEALLDEAEGPDKFIRIFTTDPGAQVLINGEDEPASGWTKVRDSDIPVDLYQSKVFKPTGRYTTRLSFSDGSSSRSINTNLTEGSSITAYILPNPFGVMSRSQIIARSGEINQALGTQLDDIAADISDSDGLGDDSDGLGDDIELDFDFEVDQLDSDIDLGLGEDDDGGNVLDGEPPFLDSETCRWWESSEVSGCSPHDLEDEVSMFKRVGAGVALAAAFAAGAWIIKESF